MKVVALGSNSSPDLSTASFELRRLVTCRRVVPVRDRETILGGLSYPSRENVRYVPSDMDDSTQAPFVDRLETSLAADAPAEARAHLERLERADAATRKTALRTLRRTAETRPTALEPVLEDLSRFLTDEERAIRLTAAKLFVAVAEAEPDATAAVVSPLADRLADRDEFYYVRARSAEALGYVALDRPEAVASPEVLADLRVGLSFDEPEVKEKLSKALEYVALGDQSRLRHHVADLSGRLTDPNDLVRYHLCTALVAVGCEHPEALSEGVDALADRLADENPYVRGRAAEALGLLVRSDSSSDSAASVPDVSSVTDGDTVPFLVDRVRFANDATDGGSSIRPEIGSIGAIRDRTAEIAGEIAAPDGEECPHCGFTLPETGPPMCPQCGGPH